jgi:flagellar basal-body rod modification protein FlgD
MSTPIIGNSYLSSLYSASNTASTGTSTGTGTSTSGTLSETDFLKLLTSQLQNQDPLNPTSDTDFVSQLSTFSNMQQMTSMGTNMSSMLSQQSYSNAVSMIGKQVTTSDNKSGVVSQVSIANGTPYLYVGNNQYQLSDITSVSNATQ